MYSSSDDELYEEQFSMPLPPRYRFRDLILGDHHMGGVHSEDDRRYVVCML